MTHKVELRPSGHTFEVSENKYVLTAGLEAGWNMSHSYKVGMCRTCRAKLIEVELSNYLQRATHGRWWDRYPASRPAHRRRPVYRA